MKIEITKEKPEWNTSSLNQRRCVMVKFENQTFKWMPTYQQMQEIMKALKEIEEESWKKELK